MKHAKEYKFDSLNRSIYETIQEISPDRTAVIPAAFWTNKHQFIRFKPIFTEEGLCFTFNSINSREIYSDEIASELLTVRDNPSAAQWNVEDGYRSNVNVNESEVYPNRVFGASLRDSLQTTPSVILDESFGYCGFPAPGTLISLHMPDELPRFSNNYIFIPADHSVFISIKPKVIATSEGLRSYAPHERGCYFQSKRRLRFFKSYTQQKCELECLANFTKAECGCVRFWMPRDNSTKVCRLFEIFCCETVERRFVNSLMVKECDCLPDCASVKYYVETSQVSKYLTNGDLEYRKQQANSTLKVNSACTISFKENYFISMNRSETSTMPDFIASCGGLLGLFMGVSVLSIVELIYFFTLRLSCALRRQRRVQPSTRRWARVNHFRLFSSERRRRRSV